MFFFYKKFYFKTTYSSSLGKGAFCYYKMAEEVEHAPRTPTFSTYLKTKSKIYEKNYINRVTVMVGIYKKNNKFQIFFVCQNGVYMKKLLQKSMLAFFKKFILLVFKGQRNGLN